MAGSSEIEGALSLDEAAVKRIVGEPTFSRGRGYAADGAVVSHKWIAEGHHVFGEIKGTGFTPYTAWVRINRTDAGEITSFTSNCTCPVHLNCKHAVALLLASVDPSGPAAEAAPATRPWEMPLRGMLRQDRTQRDETEFALQFELTKESRSYRTGLVSAPRVGLRPVSRGRSGKWIRTGLSWQTLPPGGALVDPVTAEQLDLLREIVALETASRSATYYGGGSQIVYLDTLRGRRIWNVLAELHSLGLPFVQPDEVGAVTLISAPADVVIEVDRADGALLLRPAIRAGMAVPALDSAILLGSPAHGLAWWRDEEEVLATGTLHLAPLADRIDPIVSTLLDRRVLEVPADDEAHFFARYYPELRQRASLVSVDESIVLPQPSPPVLALDLTYADDAHLDLAWHWDYALGDAVRREPLSLNGPSRGRDLEQETSIRTTVDAIVGDQSGVLADRASLSGLNAIRFLSDLLPQLTSLADVAITTHGEPRDYREATEGPVVEVAASSTAGASDWLDLAVTVTVDGEDVPFDRLFVALASGDQHLVLPSGTWFTLDRPELNALASLIAEARAINDNGPQTARITRFQSDLWRELEELGVITGQAAEWRASMQALSQLTEITQPPLPEGLNAVLRPYQTDGFAWLAFLRDYGLGGVLADEMGLGKTLQAIALMLHAKDHGETKPYLVVAPTSVVYNWSVECERFAPGLDVRMITETGRKRETTMAETIEGADVVVTSYALFRLEFDEYAASAWAGLILDEAQFVKNSKSQTYRCARLLTAPFKLAITGTPMENNLGELWSLLSITAPGLFPLQPGFDGHFRNPIEKDNDRERLAELRRRIKPLMLRRTKEQVVTDLPDKQEQVVELVLNPDHRRIYDTHLQRERQKVLGLLGSFERNRFEIFRSLTLLRQASLDPVLIDPKYHDIPSTKLDALMELVTEISREGHRVLVFSQFTRFLGNARQRLDAAKIDYCYLDGATKKRHEVLETFRSGDAPVFLISLKAGGFGLNLTEADYCVLLDPWWNPATEAQAVDRLHRIGQTRKVMVYRLVSQDTIEEKVMSLKERKAALFDSVMDDGEIAAGGLTAADIRGILD